MSWLLIVTIAHLLNAGAFLADKFLLAKAVPKPAVYAFWIGVLGLVALVLLPFGFVIPTLGQFAYALFAGGTFEVALLFFFAALRRLETSRVVPVVGGLQPLIILVLSYAFLGERLSRGELFALALLVLGSIVVSYDGERLSLRALRSQRRGWLYACIAAIIFSLSFTLTKAVFTTQPFISGFVWIRIGAFLTVLLFLLRREWRHDILEKQERPKGKLAVLFFAGQSAGAVSALLMNYAIKLASVTLVTAMQGLQYAFLFFLAIVLGRRFIQLRERLNTVIVIRKSLAIVCISVGLVVLAYA